MSKLTDLTAFATQVWLIEPEAARFLLAQVIAGTLDLEPDQTPIIYGYDDYVWFPTAQQENSTAVLRISGVIDAYSAQYYCNLLAKIFSDPNVSTLIVKIDGPGGLANAGNRVADCLKNAPIRTLALVDYGQAGSAHYMIACSCDLVWASRPVDMIGSIGTYATWQDWSKYYEKMGVVTKDLYADQSTEKNQDAIEARKGNFQPIIDRMTAEASRFIDYVKAQRGDKLNYTDETDPFHGRMYNATDALAIGLIDQIGAFPDAVSAVRALATTTLTPEDTMFGFAKMTAFEAVKALAAAEITDAHLTAMNEQLATSGYSNVLVVSAAQLEQATAQANQITALQAQINALTTSETTLKAEVTRLGTQPGATPTAPVKVDAQAETIKVDGNALTPQQIIDDLPHNKAAAQAGY